MQDIDQVLPLVSSRVGAEGGTLAGRLLEAICGALTRRDTRRVIEGLSDSQLTDAGIDRALVLGNQPVIAVDARLATYLASLR